MTTPKWMVGLMAVAALLVAQVENDKGCNDDECGPCSEINKVDEE